MVRVLSEGTALFSSDVALLLSGQRFGCYRNRGNRLGVRIRFGGVAMWCFWMLKGNHQLKCGDSEGDQLILSLPKYNK